MSEVAPIQKNNGLSYAGLPDSQVVLDIPPEQDPLIRYLASSFLRDGRRHTAERRATRVLLYLHTLTRAQPLDLLRQAVQRVMPAVRVTRHRHSAKDIQIPVALTEKQQVRHAVKWMLKASETRGGRTVEERLAREIVLVLNGSSASLKQKEAQHSLAMVNRYVLMILERVGKRLIFYIKWQHSPSKRIFIEVFIRF